MSSEVRFESVLTVEQRNTLKNDATQTRIENEIYLRDHPEIKDILHYFMGQVLLKKPENVKDFAAELFSDPKLAKKVSLNKRTSIVAE
ncbi:RIIa domain-containing protein 1 [Rhizoclosmatium sp. JEL0117]|nr:RIIa domain-containing protein 1 [Rhizoclosmatium sp. JEL0117]